MAADSSDAWRIQETANFICTRKYTKIAAQFPDKLLQHVTSVSFDLQNACKEQDHVIKVCRLYFKNPAFFLTLILNPLITTISRLS